ncbi:phosphoglycerate dehydrogenase [Feifania hominis]|uniref:phosphoglycerate dehydrogenase n=1 Tax=Feifania hominis TaxID=2763660 RepID=UPI002016A6AF
MGKILITPRSFAKTDDTPKRLLMEAGYELICNPAGSILTREQMQELIEDADGVIIGVDPLDREIISAGRKLRAIAKYGVGTDNIDLAFARERGIPVSVTAGANSNAVADYAFALILACARQLTQINEMCHRKNWGKVVTGDVYGKTIGIIGLGAIGKGVARRARGFDMTVLAYDALWDEAYAEENGIVRAQLEEIYRESDFISLHIPLTPQTENLIDEEAFKMMKKGAVLVNTARGGLVDETALIQALHDGTLSAAGIDAFAQEPPDCEKLYSLPNLIMGSHCGASTRGAAEQMSRMAAENILRDLSR